MRAVFVWSQQNANLFSLKITSVIRTLSDTDNGHFITFPKKKEASLIRTLM